MNDSRLEYLFQQFFNSKAIEAEKEELMQMLSDPRNEEKIKQFMEQAWKQMNTGDDIFTSDQSEEMLNSIIAQGKKVTEIHENSAKWRTWYWIAAAAMIILMAGSIVYLLNQDSSKPRPVKQTLAVVDSQIKPGGDKAYLTLSDGSTLILDTAKNGQLTIQGNTEVNKIDGKVLYEKNKSAEAGTLVYNTISTPYGGQYQIVLSDGTKVWLNAASSLRFPLSFIGKKREVFLTGEAYFEVEKNPGQPFLVKIMEGMDVEVLGTTFNVMAYNDEENIKTTLLEGKVKINNGGNIVGLSPNQQAVLNRNNSQLTKSEADVEEAVAWKNGRFYFNNENILSIMRKLSRWYNIDVYYPGKVPHGHYAGTIKRQADISKVLEMLELPGGIKFNIEGRKVFVSSK